jgi:hypothetical protein
MRHRHAIGFIVLITLLASGVAGAQTFRGAIEGTVTDSTGAAVPGAKITVTSSETGLTREAQTDNFGSYRLAELPVGTYSVTASKSGFRTQTARGVSITVAGNQRVDVTLSAGEVRESVVVTADVPLVETSGNNQGGVISAQQAEDLPVNGRDYTKLLVLVPGATGDPSGVSDSPGSFGLFSVNGNRGRSNNYLLDGTDMNDGYRNLPSINEAGVFGTPATILPVDAIAELPVINGGEAEFGRNSGAIVNIVTKSGSNNWHGSAYEFFRNDALDARNFFNPESTPKNAFHNNQFGGSLGGAIFPGKTFFFVAYEGQRESGGTPATTFVPTTGDLADFTAAGGTLNPVIQNLLARNPWSIPGAVGGLAVGPPGGLDVPVTNNFKNRVDSVIGKIDQNLRASDRLTGRYFFGDSDQSFPLGLVGGSSVPGYNTITPTTVHVLSLSYTWVQSPRLLIEFRGGYNHFFESFLPQDVGFDPSTIGLNTGVTNPRDFGLPQIRVSGYSNIGATLGINRARTDVNSQIFNNYSFTAGAHNWKWGYEYRRTTIDQFFDAGYRGLLRFQGLDLDDPLTPFDDTLPINTFLSGTTTGGRQATGRSDRMTAQNSHAFYIQDNWKLQRRLTFNWGLRWDYFGVIGEDKNRFSLFDPTVGLRLVDQLYPRDLNNFSPRISAAWDVFGNSKTILRAGWGVFFDTFSHDFFIGQLPFNTLNPGPAYNGVGSDPILFNFSPQPISTGAPVFAAADFAGTDVFTVDQNIATPYVQNFNVNVEHEVSRNLAIQVGYVGSQGRKLFRYRDINQGFTDDAGVFHQPFENVALPSPPNPDGTVPFYVNQFESSATSGFNALQVSARVRNWHGLSSVLNYTWSHSIDNASDGQDYVANASQPDNSFDPRREFANSNFDTRNRLTWNFSYDMPRSEWEPLNGWSISGVLSVADGQPFTVHSFESFNGTQEFFERPDVIGDPFAGTQTPETFLNLGAFAAPCNWDPVNEACADPNPLTLGTPYGPAYHFGSEPRNAFVGPNFRSFDFSIAKNTKLTEKLNMQLRADFFNIFNHPNFANPLLPSFAVDLEFNDIVLHDPANPACAGGGSPGCRGIGQGFLPLTATPDVAIGNPFLGGGGARNIQLAVKFTF